MRLIASTILLVAALAGVQGRPVTENRVPASAAEGTVADVDAAGGPETCYSDGDCWCPQPFPSGPICIGGQCFCEF
ncbi:hypothetical protein GGR56DRAFT_675596 [Xylariaceae sp. FL0804]|nr:hypothetical protein GGR56DRAFT_675596 [Xylariaceae sp. FL0804]